MRKTLLVSTLLLGSSSLAQPGLSPADVDFLSRAGLANLFSVQLGELAARQASSQAAREHGRVTARDHAELARELTEVAQGLAPNYRFPNALGSNHTAKLSSLATAGSNFDSLYHRYVTENHQAMVTVYHKYLSHPRANPALKPTASRALALAEQQLLMAASLPGQ